MFSFFSTWVYDLEMSLLQDSKKNIYIYIHIYTCIYIYIYTHAFCVNQMTSMIFFPCYFGVVVLVALSILFTRMSKQPNPTISRRVFFVLDDLEVCLEFFCFFFVLGFSMTSKCVFLVLDDFEVYLFCLVVFDFVVCLHVFSWGEEHLKRTISRCVLFLFF